MNWVISPWALAGLAVGSIALLAAAAGLFTGRPAVLSVAVPAALVGLAVTFLAVRRLERDVGAAR